MLWWLFCYCVREKRGYVLRPGYQPESLRAGRPILSVGSVLVGLWRVQLQMSQYHGTRKDSALAICHIRFHDGTSIYFMSQEGLERVGLGICGGVCISSL